MDQCLSGQTQQATGSLSSACEQLSAVHAVRYYVCIFVCLTNCFRAAGILQHSIPARDSLVLQLLSFAVCLLPCEGRMPDVPLMYSVRHQVQVIVLQVTAPHAGRNLPSLNCRMMCSHSNSHRHSLWRLKHWTGNGHCYGLSIRQ